jgi:hypothetical protein
MVAIILANRVRKRDLTACPLLEDTSKKGKPCRGSKYTQPAMRVGDGGLAGS